MSYSKAESIPISDLPPSHMLSKYLYPKPADCWLMIMPQEILWEAQQKPMHWLCHYLFR